MNIFMGEEPVHVAHVVPDLDEAVNRLLDAGFGPAFFIRETQMAARYRGEPVTVPVSAAFIVVGGLLTEIVAQDDDARSTFTDFIARRPHGGLHHAAFVRPDFSAALEELQARGIKLLPHMEYLGPDGAAFEAYFEPEGKPDAILVQLALPSPLDPVYEEIMDISAKWDGSEPRRDFWALVPADAFS